MTSTVPPIHALCPQAKLVLRQETCPLSIVDYESRLAGLPKKSRPKPTQFCTNDRVEGQDAV
jgi:hypothetical protein